MWTIYDTKRFVQYSGSRHWDHRSLEWCHSRLAGDASSTLLRSVSGEQLGPDHADLLLVVCDL